jgi:phage terminase large subunit GpA-like protein
MTSALLSEIEIDQPLEITPAQLADMENFLCEKIREIPSELPTLKISEHAEKHRIMPSGTPRPGPLDLSYTPYLIEPMDNMSPFSPIRRTIIMKGHQLGFTMLAECVLCYYMGYAPADILFMSATQDLLERWASRRLEPALDSYDLRRHIYAQYANKNTRKLGDKTFSKEYFGCRLDMASAQAASSQRATDKRILIRDEIDGAPAELKTGEGNWLDVSAGRVDFWGARAKILDFSTPTLVDSSAVNFEFQIGDQRYYFVPCPKCGEMQVLTRDRLHPININGQIDDTSYICKGQKECELKNHHKTEMMAIQNGAQWKPTAISTDPFVRSYQIGTLYSPVGTTTWHDIYKKSDKAKDKPAGMRAIINLEDGLPYRETGERIPFEKTVGLRGNYASGEVPEGVIFLTGSGDVQRGAEKWKDLSEDELNAEIQKAGRKAPDKKFPRVEIEILGHGDKYRTWSVDYKIFYGKIDDPFGGAWADLHKWIYDDYGLYYKKKDDKEFQVGFFGIDSGDGENTDTVYQFCEGIPNMFPIKGFKDLTQQKPEKGDQISKDNSQRFKPKKISETIILIEIATNYYRNQLYKRIQRTLASLDEPDLEQISGFCGFPRDYPDEYFKQLTNPERKKDGSFDKRGRPAEAHDNRVYGLCMGDFWLDRYVKERQEEIRRVKGVNPLKIKDFDKKMSLLEQKYQQGDCTDDEAGEYERAIADFGR